MCHFGSNCCLSLGMYQISAPAENRPLLQICLKSGYSQNIVKISVFGRICKMGHKNTAMFRISTSLEKLRSRCCHICYSFVYFAEISPSSRDWWDLALSISIEFKQFHEQMTNPAGFLLSNPPPARFTKLNLVQPYLSRIFCSSRDMLRKAVRCHRHDSAGWQSSLFTTPWLFCRIMMTSLIHHAVLSDSRLMIVTSSQLMTWFSVLMWSVIADLFCSHCDCLLVLPVYFRPSCNSTSFLRSFIWTPKLRPVSPT